MAQYKVGTASVTNGASVVQGQGTAFLLNAAAGNLFAIQNENVWYEILSVQSDTQLTLTTNYTGTTKTAVAYAVQRDFTAQQSYPLPAFGDTDTASLIALAFNSIDQKIASIQSALSGINSLTLTGDLTISITAFNNFSITGAFSGVSLALSGAISGATTISASGAITAASLNVGSGSVSGNIFNAASIGASGSISTVALLVASTGLGATTFNSATSSYVINIQSATGQQAGFAMFDGATAKWEILKNTDNSLLVYDFSTGRSVISVLPGGVPTFAYGLSTASIVLTGAITGATSLSLNGAISGATSITLSGALSGASSITTSGSVNTSGLVVKHPTLSQLVFQKADGTNGYSVGRSLSNNNAQDFFLYDNVLGGAVLKVDSAGVVSFPKGYLRDAPGFRNRIINGCLRVWQRGTSFASPNGIYTADRFFFGLSGGTAAVSKVASPSGFRLPDALNLVSTSTPSGGVVSMATRLEGRHLNDLENVPTTVSFDMIGSTSAGSLQGTLYILTNTALDNSTFTGANAVNFTVPATGQKVVVAMPAIVGLKFGAQVMISVTQQTSAGNMNYTISALQWEKGAVSNDFEFRPLQDELQLCQRFFQMSYSQGTVPGTATAAGAALFGLNGLPSAAYASVGINVNFKVAMRAGPTIVSYSTVTGAAGMIADIQNGVDVTAALGAASDSGVGLFATMGTAAANIRLRAHWTASAEL